jgi:hypothetical protein
LKEMGGGGSFYAFFYFILIPGKEKKVAGIFLPSAIWSNGKVLFWDPVLN